MDFLKLFCLFVMVNAIHSVNNDPPKWHHTYRVNGEISIPLAKVKEPFVAWYDGLYNRSRIDFHNGVTKTYQLYKKNNIGLAFQVATIKTNNGSYIEKCMQTDGNAIFPVFGQSVLPDMKNYKKISQHIITEQKKEKRIEIWGKNRTTENIVSQFEMWLYRNGDIIYPIKYNVKKFDKLLSSHFDDYSIIYNNFVTVKLNSDNFIVKVKCEYKTKLVFDNYVYNFNPMMEFINDYEKHMVSAFENFKRIYEKTYANGTAEHFRRKNAFRQTLRFIYSNNRANLGFTLGVNHLADYFDEEYKALSGSKRIKSIKKKMKAKGGGSEYSYLCNQTDLKNLPVNMDWRTKGAVTPVQTQGPCGACWSMSVTGNMDSAYFIKHGVLKKFSEQMLIDCTKDYGNKGCEDGETYNCYFAMIDIGITTEDIYGPYLARDSNCHLNKIAKNDLVKISRYVHVPPKNENALKTALVKNGPISLLIHSGNNSFKTYKGGVYYDLDCLSKDGEMDHAVLLVGYGERDGEPYWLVKNSWSTKWGEDGYILISRNDNICGVLNDPSYIVL